MKEKVENIQRDRQRLILKDRKKKGRRGEKQGGMFRIENYITGGP